MSMLRLLKPLCQLQQTPPTGRPRGGARGGRLDGSRTPRTARRPLRHFLAAIETI